MCKLIKAVNITKVYGKQQVLDNITIEIHQGDIYGFIGRNGAGKTTFMRILMGLSFASSGDFELLENNNVLEARKEISAFIESPAFYENMTAAQNLKNHCILLGISTTNIDSSLESVGLLNAKDKKVKNFSLGMKQRLALAKALINESKLIILDEPTNGLDPEGIEMLREIILRLNRKKQVTFLISSHYLAELQNVASRYGFIEKGKICKEISNVELDKELQKTLIIEVNDVNAALMLLKEKKDIECKAEYFESKEKKSGSLVILENDNIDITEIYELFRKNNIHINSIRSKQLTLEDYFFKVTSARKRDKYD